MITTFHKDNMSLMAITPDKHYDLAIVDPEYGRGEHGGKKRSSLCKQKNGSIIRVKGGDYIRKEWDNVPARKEYFDELFRVSKHQIIWGANYYDENFGPGRVIWDKVNDGSDQSDCEIAYNSLSDRVDLFRFMWRGMMQGKSTTEGHIMQGNKKLNEKRIHPTQKPVALYKWLLRQYAKPGNKILDTHGGSFSHAIACYDMGFDLDICEIDDEYYNDGLKRLYDHIAISKEKGNQLSVFS